MSADTSDEIILITVSWQALKRIQRLRQPEFFVTDSIVVKFFAATYIEATLNYLIQKMCDKEGIPNKFKKNDRGLANKISYFYCKYDLKKYDHMSYTDNEVEINKAFTDFEKIKKYRDDIAHGFINNHNHP